MMSQMVISLWDAFTSMVEVRQVLLAILLLLGKRLRVFMLMRNPPFLYAPTVVMGVTFFTYSGHPISQKQGRFTATPLGLFAEMTSFLLWPMLRLRMRKRDLRWGSVVLQKVL
ncbi:hypothetical protein Tc00.1047053507005.10 [Trypanosoma cruzi]|uniref:Uncharacterized protein n=1 Tax=Trypanosoma cruzi (strain CL Brener) TaxID=353153 RepID=Q4D2Q4_TRYCC|nr:hypothetical protein Tc00.1047053507005.10 [Trypanosoma cruzi]EAN86799.1 hypothetical protein Tc00.1047053507005.10 [Trypanosoma cruzi]|eukprot:XP_808650.1 hypothetical protein [Trypanosoma cruzi strain CL Brener]